MTDQTPVYGIDKEIRAKIESKYSLEREQEAKKWIENLIGEPFPLDDFAESLKDGMENISIFLKGAEALGVPKHDLFQTIDLFEKKNMTQVIDSLFAISRYGYKAGTCENVRPKLADKQKAVYSQQAANAANATFNTYQYGYTGGANQSGMNFGQRRDIAGKDPYAQYK
ncbi:hypothetical protein G6F56_001773 [Rhizopus delemar]|nr:hypothetical protein G6F56_001773 [Rhizopus delemar]